MAGSIRLLGVLLDPTLYAIEGEYEPGLHLGATFSVERLFTSLTSSLVLTGLDEYTRRLHLFEVLDLLDGMHLGGYDATLDYRRLERQLDELAARVPAAIERLLLPRCRAGIDALKTVERGFIHERTRDDRVILRDDQGQEQEVHGSRAVAALVRATRNAGHGFTRAMVRPRTLSLLSAHDGALPPEINDIALLHLAQLIADSSLLERPLAATAGTTI